MAPLLLSNSGVHLVLHLRHRVLTMSGVRHLSRRGVLPSILVSHLKAKISQIEDEMLECLDRMDDFGNAIAAKRKEYKDLIEITNQEKQTIEHDAAEKMKLLGQLEMDRNRASKIIDPKLLSKYTVIKDIVKIMAIAPVKNAVCRGCNLNIPPQMYNELQKGDDLRFCPNCQRMIYWDNS